MRQIGNRVGQELAFSLISQEIEFLNEMMDQEHAGLGILLRFEPEFH